MKYIYLLALLLLQAAWCLGLDTITVTGKTENRKNGAVVVSSETGLAYFVGGLSHWEENKTGKIVKVTGELHVTVIKPNKRKKEERQELVGTIRTVLHPKWEFIYSKRDFFSNHILLLRDNNPVPDTCLCPNDAARQKYLFIDEYNFVHFVPNGFGSEHLQYKLDSSYKDNVCSYWFVPYLQQHDASTVFKFEIYGDELVQFKRKKDGKFLKFIFYDFLNKKGTNVSGPFFGEHKPADSLSTKLLKEDSVIKFNEHIFHCWWFEQVVKWQGYIYTHRFCIDKETSLLVALEFITKFVGAGFVEVGPPEALHISAIMELSDETLQGLKMWKAN